MPSDPPAAYVPPTAAPAAIGVVFAVPGAPSAPPVPPARPVAAPAAIGAVYAVPGVPAAPPATPAAAAANPQAIGAVYAPGNAPGALPVVTPQPDGLDGSYITVIGVVTLDGTPVDLPEALYASAPNPDGRRQWDSASVGDGAGVYWSEGVWTLAVTSGNVAWESTSPVMTPNMIPLGPWHATTNPTAWRPLTAGVVGVPVVVWRGLPPPPAITP